MNEIISIKDIDFSYGKHEIFKNFSLDVEKGDFITIIGPNGSGKSTLVRILLGLEKTTVENMQVESSEIRKRVNKIAEFVGIEELLEKEPHSLSGGQKQLVSLASALAINPDVLILDEAFTMLDVETKEKIYKKIKYLNETENLTILNVSHDTEDTLNGNKILVLDNGKVILYGPKEEVLLEEKKFNNLGLALPFMAELSIKLKYYDLIDDLIFDMDEMVNKLWK